MSTRWPVCNDCRSGNHQHDRHTGLLPGSRAGDDAGCPRAVANGNPCGCNVTLTPMGRASKAHCPTCRCHAVATDDTPGGDK